MILGILGTGLIGSSIGMRSRELGWHVVGCDANAEAAEEALRCGAIDEAVTRDEMLTRSEAIVIAAHTSATIRELERFRFTQPRKARLVIDVSSVKAPIVAAAQGVRNFVATHPMAGRERSGPQAASRDVFDKRTWLYVPSGDAELDARATAFIASLGGIPVPVDAAEHDRIVAFTSHLPQVAATLFAARMRPGVEPFMGPTAYELLRLSRSSIDMWRDILLANSENVCRELRALSADLEATAAELERGDAAVYERQARAVKRAASASSSS